MCALALAACGTERAVGTDLKTAPDASGGTSPAAPSPTWAMESEDAEFLAYMQLLLSLARPCLKDSPEPSPAPPEETPFGPGEELPTLPLPGSPPSGKPRDPQAATKEVELGPEEKCEARIHARRITKALMSTPDPTPEEVGKVLRGLGYLDKGIHGPQRSGKSVVFTLDLRMMGSVLCLFGSVTGAKSRIEPYGASEDVGCLDVRRRR